HELLDREIGGRLRVSIFADKRSDGRKGDVESSALFYDSVHVLVDGRLIQGVDGVGMRTRTGFGDPRREILDFALRPASEKHFCTLSRTLGRDGGANRTTSAKNHRALSVQDS